MEAKVNYTIVGLVIVFLTATLISVSLWLSVSFDQKQYTTYAVYMKEAVSGLSDDSPVKFNGVQIGHVQKIELDHNNPQHVRLLLSIESDTPITMSTRATLISQGITGTTYVGLAAESSDLTPLIKKANQQYPIIPTAPSLFHQLDRVLKEVSENINAVSVQIKKIFDKENAAYIQKTLHNMRDITDVIAKNGKNIDQSLEETHHLLVNLSKSSNALPEIMRELNSSVNTVNNMAIDMANAAQKVSSTMDAGKTTIDKISQQTLPPAVSLINRLNNIAANLEKVSSQMRQNPAVIIRGVSPPRPGPGE